MFPINYGSTFHGFGAVNKRPICYKSNRHARQDNHATVCGGAIKKHFYVFPLSLSHVTGNGDLFIGFERVHRDEHNDYTRIILQINCQIKNSLPTHQPLHVRLSKIDLYVGVSIKCEICPYFTSKRVQQLWAYRNSDYSSVNVGKKCSVVCQWLDKCSRVAAV